MNIKRNILLATIGLVLAAGAATGASADMRWDANHPRRAEVNARLHAQNLRIHEARREGELNARQAHRLHVADRHIRLRERAFARRHDGHISRGEQFRLNHQENRVSQQIPG